MLDVICVCRSVLACWYPSFLMSPAQAGSGMFLVTKQIHGNALRKGVQGSVEQIYNTEVSQFLAERAWEY